MILLVATRKGGFTLNSDKSRRKWTVEGPIMLGNIIHHIVQDPREPKTLLMAAKAGHLGPTVFRSTDFGRTWKEAATPPAFRKAEEGERKRAVEHVFWLTPGHASEAGVWYAGSTPQGLFRSEDGGVNWEPVAGFNDHPMNAAWTGRPEDSPPDGATLHSINVDPRDANHLYLGMSLGGFFESTDRGQNWSPLNKGCAADFIPTPDAEYGHDPHCVRISANPDRLYMQNHCGVYRLDKPSDTWVRIGLNLPKKVGDIGFGVAVHPRDAKVAWVFPMDGTEVWPRTSINGKPAVYRTTDAGKKWTRLDKGLPDEQAWFTVKRQALTCDSAKPAGVYFGTTAGEVWGSRNEGDSWNCIARNLPHIYAVECAQK